MTNKLISVSFSLNGKTVETRVTTQQTVLEMLRQNFRLKAVKEGCGKGECGACSITLNDLPINSCLKLAATLKPGDSIVTVEGYGEDALMQTIQQAYIDEGAVQCGFCIPGMTIATWHLLNENPKPDQQAIKTALSGNICRCTGYRKIEEAVKKAAERKQSHE